jgi:hypothetical protein
MLMKLTLRADFFNTAPAASKNDVSHFTSGQERLKNNHLVLLVYILDTL